MPADDRRARPGADVVAGTAVPAPGAVTDTALAGVPVPPAPGSGAVLSDAALRRALHGLPGVDQTGAQARAAALATRSIKREAKLWALETAVKMVDLTTLEGADTPGKVRGLCAKALHPDPDDPSVPPVAAVCVYPDLVALARGEVAGSKVAVASVATAFPSGRASLAVKLADVADAVKAGADFIKTSTGKITPAATPPVALVMLSAVRDFAEATGRRVGVKVAGGIRTAKDAIRYLVLVREIAGPEWLTPDLFRIGASSLLNDLLMQRSKQLTGAYAGPDYFTLD